MIYAVVILAALCLYFATACWMLYREVVKTEAAMAPLMAQNRQHIQVTTLLVERTNALTDENLALRTAFNMEEGDALVVFARKGFEQEEDDDGD